MYFGDGYYLCGRIYAGTHVYLGDRRISNMKMCKNCLRVFKASRVEV
jgi:hypothetical protein